MNKNALRSLAATCLTLFLSVSCRTTTPQAGGGSSIGKGLSATASAENVAVLMTSYGSTPQNGGLFETDMEQFRQLVTDPAGNYRFKTLVGQRAGHYEMLAYIRSAASQVSAEGTLLIFITAHGSQQGTIEPEGQAYATLGYNDILQAVREGRGGAPFRRLVLFVSACYSGSWMYYLPSSEGLFRERLVMTSVGPNELSYIALASRGMLQAFQQLKDVPNATLYSLVAQAQANVGSIQYSAVPESIINEPLVNGQSAQLPDEPVISGSSEVDPSQGDQNADQQGRILAVTQRDSAGVELFVYSPFTAKKIEMQTYQGWYDVGDVCVSQPNYPTIFSTRVDSSWATESNVRVRLTLPTGKTIEQDAEIEHR